MERESMQQASKSYKEHLVGANEVGKGTTGLRQKAGISLSTVQYRWTALIPTQSDWEQSPER